MELYPRIFGFNVKHYISCRVSMTAWPLLLISYALAEVCAEALGRSFEFSGVDNMGRRFEWARVWSAVRDRRLHLLGYDDLRRHPAGLPDQVLLLGDRVPVHARHHPRSLRSVPATPLRSGRDAVTDNVCPRRRELLAGWTWAGYYICWGFLCWVPSLYTSSALFLVNHQFDIAPWKTAVMIAFGVLCTYLNWQIDEEKIQFRKSKVRAVSSCAHAMDFGLANATHPWVSSALVLCVSGPGADLGQEARVHCRHIPGAERQEVHQPPACIGLVGHEVRPRPRRGQGVAVCRRY